MTDVAYESVSGTIYLVERSQNCSSKRYSEFTVRTKSSIHFNSGGLFTSFHQVLRHQLLKFFIITSILSVFYFYIRLHTWRLPWILSLIMIQLISFIFRTHRKVVSETLLVVAGFGVQTTTTFLSGKQYTHFIPWSDLIDIIIAEAITMQQVLFYMCLLVRSDSSEGPELKPLFMHTWPRLPCLNYIYCKCQVVLASSPERSKL
ncbi:uncharacterized protein LOC143038630 [Oratosquilla oratoria]|uniref:uncharacterized protein LOC143038630 n=1 Tax=Oratosquilla oratoria TaxID=337810 RepID=UPI003F7681B9